MATMYRLPRLVDPPRVTEMPGSMYQMPVLNNMSDLDLAAAYYGQTRANTKNGPDVAALEARQEAVLSRLRHLKARLDKVQGNVLVTSSPVSAATTLGAPAHTSPIKSVSNPKREMVKAVAAMGGHLADLTSLQFDSLVQPKRGEEGGSEARKQHDSILHRLGCLRTELDKLSTASQQATVPTPPEEPLGLVERQRGILGVITALKEEMERLATVQNHPSNKVEPPSLDVRSHHKEVIKKLNLLREELVRLVQGLQELPWEVERLPGCRCGLPPYDDIPTTSSHTFPTSTLISLSSTSISHPPISKSLPSPSLSNYSSFDISTSVSTLISQSPAAIFQSPTPVSHPSFPSKLPSPVSIPHISLSIPLHSPFSSLFRPHSPQANCSVHDLVISANPGQPPFCLLLLRKLLKQAGTPVFSTNHMHSSITQVPKSLRSCFSDQPLPERREHPLAFTLHWKDVTVPMLMVSPLRQTQISGEANIVRYVSRLFPLASPFNYEATATFPQIAETDQLLDLLSRQLSPSCNNKERQAALRMLNGRLGKNTYIMGDCCGIADILAWSLVRQCGLDSGATNNVTKWYKTLSSMADLGAESGASESKSEKSRAQGKSDSHMQGPAPLVNGTLGKKSHINRAGLEKYLKRLGLAYRVTDHEEVFTVEALMKAVAVKKISGLHMKNLFLKDKKKKDLYLLSARHDAKVKLNDVAKQLGIKELRFADESVMLDTIGVAQGCVTAFALANDSEHQVTFLLDSAALDSTHSYVNFHPLRNDATMGISPEDLKKFLKATGHEPKLLTFT